MTPNPRSSPHGREPRRGIAVFDMDGTIVELKSSWWLIHEAMGTVDIARTYHDMFAAGKIDYDKWAELDVGAWMGRDFSPALKALDRVRLVSGAVAAIERLQFNGILCGVVSAGLNVVLEKVLDVVKLDFAEVNELILRENRIVGWRAKVGYKDKGVIVRRLAGDVGVPLSRIAVVGDAINDLEMFELPSVFKVAYNSSSEELNRLADLVVRSSDLEVVADAILEWFDTQTKLRR